MKRCYLCDRCGGTLIPVRLVPICVDCATAHRLLKPRPNIIAMDEVTETNFITNGLGLNLAGQLPSYWQGGQ